MAKKEDFSYEILTHLGSVSHYVSLFSVCYQATNVSKFSVCYCKTDVSLGFLCVTWNTRKIYL